MVTIQLSSSAVINAVTTVNDHPPDVILVLLTLSE